MGRYLKGEGQLQQKEWKGFDSPSHMVHFLAKTRKDDPNWQHVVGAAKDFLAGRKVPKYTSTHNDLRKIIHYHPHKLAGEVMHDLRRAREGKRKGAGLTGDHLGYLKLHDCPGAQIARHQSGIENRVAIASHPSTVPQAIDLRVQNRVQFLNSLVVPPGHDLPVLHQNGTDRDSSGAGSFARFFDSGLHEFVHLGRIRRRGWRVRLGVQTATSFESVGALAPCKSGGLWMLRVRGAAGGCSRSEWEHAWRACITMPVATA